MNDRQVEALADRAEFYADHYASKNITQAELREFAAALRSRNSSATDVAIREALKKISVAAACETRPWTHLGDIAKIADAALSASEANAGEPFSNYGTDKIDKLSEKKLNCRQLARYVWDLAHNEPMCFEQDIARLFENERRAAAERAVKHHVQNLPTPPQVDREAVAAAVGESIIQQGCEVAILDDYSAMRVNGEIDVFKVADAIRALPLPSTPDDGRAEPVALTYTNYRGETALRVIIPKSVRFGSTEWHPEPQWLLLAFDLVKAADREFALRDFGHPSPASDGAIRKAVIELLKWVEPIAGDNADDAAAANEALTLERVKALLSAHAGDAAKSGGDPDLQGCEHCGKSFDIEQMTMMEDHWICPTCYAAWKTTFDACEHSWESHVGTDGDSGQYCSKCCGFVPGPPDTHAEVKG